MNFDFAPAPSPPTASTSLLLPACQPAGAPASVPGPPPQPVSAPVRDHGSLFAQVNPCLIPCGQCLVRSCPQIQCFSNFAGPCAGTRAGRAAGGRHIAVAVLRVDHDEMIRLAHWQQGVVFHGGGSELSFGPLPHCGGQGRREEGRMGHFILLDSTHILGFLLGERV